MKIDKDLILNASCFILLIGGFNILRYYNILHKTALTYIISCLVYVAIIYFVNKKFNK